MSTQVIFGLAGAVVGFFVGGGPAGAAIGWTIGSMVGTLLDPPKQEGPRLSDLKLQTSEYGRMIPILYGTMRVAGNVIWQTDLVEHTQTEGGKGGQEITTHSYTASFAVQLCEGPILGIRKVWADSRIVWQGPQDNVTFPFTLYLGTETQLPDPSMEADKGVGNVPGHRGTAYVVFTDLPMAEFNNRIPILTWEVEATGAPSIERISTWNTPGTPGYSGRAAAPLAGTELLASVLHVYVYTEGAPFSTYVDTSYDLQGNVTNTVTDNQVVNVNSTSLLSWVPSLNSSIAVCLQRGSGPTNVSAWYVAGLLVAQPVVAPAGFGLAGDEFYSVNTPPVYSAGFVYATGGNLQANAFVGRWPAPLGVPTSIGDAGYDLFTGNPAPSSGSNFSVAIADDGDVWVMGGGAGVTSFRQLWHFDPDLVLVQHYPDLPDGADLIALGAGTFTVYRNHILIPAPNVGPYTGIAAFLYRINANGTFTLVDQEPGAWPSNTNTYMHLGSGYVATNDGILRLLALETLGNIVQDISERDSIASYYDTSDLTQLVNGYQIASQMTKRNAIEPLRQGYFFDGVESDDQIVYWNRGKASVVTIPESDLAAHEYGSDMPPALETVRTMEEELPQRVNVDYINPATDYQISTQYAERLVVSSDSVTSLALPISLTDTEAIAIAYTHIDAAWTERERFTFYVSRKYSVYEPTDVVTLSTPIPRIIRLVSKTEFPNGTIKFEGLLTRSYVYSQSAVPAPWSGFSPIAPSAKVDTDTLLLDIPLVTDADYNSGFYAAMAPAAVGSWTGAGLFKSVDSGVTYGQVGATGSAATIGAATTILGDYFGGNTFDELNTVTVVLTSGTLASSTEAAVLNGANLALLGTEEFQFRTATLIATDTYVLSGLLRGRRGTEYLTSTHAVADRFVLLSTSLNIDTAPAELFQSRLYKGVSFGKTLAGVAAQTFANMGQSSRPYAPVHVGGGHAAGDVTINWTRRTRTGGTWKDFVDVPLGEASENYIVQIWDATYTLCARIIPTTTPTASYTAAQQVTDFGAAQQTVYVSVAQLGAYQLGTQTSAAIPSSGGSDTAPLAPITPYNASPVPPPGGSGGTVNMTLTWPSDYEDALGFRIGDTFVVAFTTGATWTSGFIACSEFGGAPYWRRMRLFSDLAGTLPVTNGTGWGSSATIYIGSASGQAVLTPATTYYCYITAEISPGTPSGPLGTLAPMRVTLQITP